MLQVITMRFPDYRNKPLGSGDKLQLFWHSAAMVVVADCFCIIDTNGDWYHSFYKNLLLCHIRQLSKPRHQPQTYLMKWQHLQQELDLHHHWTAPQRNWKSSLVFIYRPRCPRAKACISRFCHPFPRKLDMNTHSGYQWKSHQSLHKWFQ